MNLKIFLSSVALINVAHSTVNAATFTKPLVSTESEMVPLSGPAPYTMDDQEREEITKQIRKEIARDTSKPCCPQDMSVGDYILCAAFCLPCCQCWCNPRNKYNCWKCHARYGKPCIRACGKACPWKCTLCLPCNICGCCCSEDGTRKKPETDIACTKVCECFAGYWTDSDKKHLFRDCCIVGSKRPKPPKPPRAIAIRSRAGKKGRLLANGTAKGMIAAAGVGAVGTGAVVAAEAVRRKKVNTGDEEVDDVDDVDDVDEGDEVEDDQDEEEEDEGEEDDDEGDDEGDDDDDEEEEDEGDDDGGDEGEDEGFDCGECFENMLEGGE